MAGVVSQREERKQRKENAGLLGEHESVKLSWNIRNEEEP
jgi:hypothetical protein